MNRIFVCVDGSVYAEPCCRYASWLAQKTGAKVELIYVSSMWEYELPFLMDLGGSFGAAPYQAVTDQLEEVEEHKAKMVHEAAQKVFKQTGLAAERIKFHHETGTVVDCLNKFENEGASADLIILGKRGEGAEGARDHMGTTVERVVRATGKPTLVTNKEFLDIKRVVMAYDNGPVCQRALRWIGKSNEFADVELHVISVGQGHSDGVASDHIETAKSICQEQNHEAKFQVLSGDPEDEIASYVENVKADLLAIGAYGHSRIRELLIGSTTTDLLRRCHMPVLLFR